MVHKAVKWETESLGRRILTETVMDGGQVLRTQSLRVRKHPTSNGIRFVALLTTDFDAYDGYIGFVCPHCGSTKRTNYCQCANCGVMEW
jgi:hypothetical protein